METTKTTPPFLIQRPLIEIKEEALLNITEHFLNQLKYICSKISEVEWSGLVFFTTKGDPKELKTFIITPYYIHLMDKGTSGSTEFDDDGSAKKLYQTMPELDPFEGNGYRYGKIHSHNTMQVFHSATDVQDLQDQVEAYRQYYLSIIVNNFMDIEAKMAFIAEIADQQITPKGFKGMNWKLPKKEVLVTIDFDVETDGVNLTIPVALKERLTEITTYTLPIHQLGLYGRHKRENLNYQFQDTINDEDDMLGYSDYDVSEYRVAQGRIAIRSFLHDYYKGKVEMIDVFTHTCNVSSIQVEKIKEQLGVWYNKLGDWQRQNILLYITDVEIEIDEQNLEQLYETIWEKIKNIPA